MPENLAAQKEKDPASPERDPAPQRLRASFSLSLWAVFA